MPVAHQGGDERPPAAAPPALEGLLPLEPWSADDETSPYRFSPLLAWLVATTRPSLVSELGPGDEASLAATCEAVRRAAPDAHVRALQLRGTGDATQFGTVLAALKERFGDTIETHDDAAGLRGSGGAAPGLVHISLLDTDGTPPPELGPWLRELEPGALIALTSTASTTSSTFAELARMLSADWPSVSLSLGLTTGAVVAQRPDETGTPVIDALRQGPSAIGAFLTLFGQQRELQRLLRDLPDSPAAQALLGRVMEQHLGEREAFLSTLEVYREETARLSGELAEAHHELAKQVEASRAEREQLVHQFLDRVDELSSKISTSAARFEERLSEKDEVIEDQERRVEAYAGLAADAQGVINDMRRSTSWRMTAPVRLLSRMMAKRADTARGGPGS
jgi:hypothetical protein